MPCPVCGFTNAAGVAVCSACGTRLIAEAKPLARPGEAVCATHKDLPALQPCARCGTFYCGSCLERATDSQMYCVNCRSRGSLPWDRREELGTLRAWWQTSTLLLREPTKTLSEAPRDGTIASSMLFTLISSLAGFLTTISIYAVMFGSMAVVALSQAKELGDKGAASAFGFAGIIGFLIAYILMLIGMQIAMLFFLSGVEHLVLHLSGEKNLGGYSTTVRAHALGLAPYVLGLIPFCGLMVMGLWSLVLRCIALSQLQKVSAGKAVIAVLAPVVLMCGCLGFFYVMVLAAAFSAAGLAGQGP